MTVPWSIKLEVDFTTQPAATPSAWVNLTSRLRERGRLDIVGGIDGHATFELNNFDRALDPTNAASPYNLVPMRHARITATVGGQSFPLFRGFVEEWPPSWPDSKQGYVNVRLVDGTAWLALADADLELPQQSSHARIVALLDIAGWPAALRDIDAGVITVEEYEQTAANVFRTILDTVAAEEGEFYAAPDGKLTFRSRHHRLDREPLTVAGIDGRPVKSVGLDYGAGHLINIGRVEFPDGTALEERDDASVGAYGPRTENVRDLPIADVEAEGIAQWLVIRYAQPSTWLDSLTMEGRHAGTLPDVLARREGDLISFTHEPPGGGQAVIEGHIERVRHLISGASWEVSWNVSPYFGEGPWFTLDDSLLDSAAKLAP